MNELPALLEKLRRLTGEIVELRFKDGHVVLARLVLVDREEPLEFIYDIIRVLQQGPERWRGVQAGTVAAADPQELADVAESSLRE